MAVVPIHHSVMNLLCFCPSKPGPLYVLHGMLFPMGTWVQVLPLPFTVGMSLSLRHGQPGCRGFSEAAHPLLKGSSMVVFPELPSSAHYVWDFCSIRQSYVLIFSPSNQLILFLE